jgi:molecular chaperone DnaK
MGLAVGMDLGTSRSTVAVIHRGIAVPIPDTRGRLEHPSVVHIPADGGPAVVGHDALPLLQTDPARTVFAIKRLLGRRATDADVKDAALALPYRVAADSDGLAAVDLGGGQLIGAVELTAHVVAHLRDLAQARVGQPVTDVVVTVPAHFGEVQREATRAAVMLAGLRVLRLVNEPTAAALSVMPPLRDGRYLVYDFGGGTFDVTVLERTEDVFRVMATGGDPALGGEDLTRLLAARLVDRVAPALRAMPLAWAGVLQQAEQAKVALSSETRVDVRVATHSRVPGRPALVTETVTRDDVDVCAAQLCFRSLQVVARVMSEAQVLPEDLDALLLVGGTSSVPAVRDAVLQSIPRPVAQGVLPSVAVAVGAARVAQQVLEGQSRSAGLLLDVVPQTVGVADGAGGFIPLLRRNMPLPCHAQVVLPTRRDGQGQMVVEVLQGNSVRAVENVTLGVLAVQGLPADRAGGVCVEVNVDLDANGLLQVVAVDLRSGRVHGSFARAVGHGPVDRPPPPDARRAGSAA